MMVCYPSGVVIWFIKCCFHVCSHSNEFDVNCSLAHTCTQYNIFNHYVLLQAGQDVLRRIHCHQVFDIYDLLSLLEDVRGTLEQDQHGDNSQVRMVIIDSVSALLAPLLGGSQVDG